MVTSTRLRRQQQQQPVTTQQQQQLLLQQHLQHQSMPLLDASKYRTLPALRDGFGSGGGGSTFKVPAVPAAAGGGRPRSFQELPPHLAAMHLGSKEHQHRAS